MSDTDRHEIIEQMKWIFFSNFGIDEVCLSPKFDKTDQVCEECISNYIMSGCCSIPIKHFPDVSNKKLEEIEKFLFYHFGWHYDLDKSDYYNYLGITLFECLKHKENSEVRKFIEELFDQD